jgi:hypothetical protein
MTAWEGSRGGWGSHHGRLSRPVPSLQMDAQAVANRSAIASDTGQMSDGTPALTFRSAWVARLLTPPNEHPPLKVGPSAKYDWILTQFGRQSSGGGALGDVGPPEGRAVCHLRMAGRS